MGSHSVLQSQKWSLQCLSQQTQPQWGVLCSDGHTLPQESAPLQPPFPSLALKQSEKSQTKKTPKAEALPYFQQKEESITQGNLPCRSWLCRSLHCCRNICVTALLTLLGSYPCGATSHCSQRGQILGSSSPLWPELPQTLRCHGKSHTIFWVGSRDPVLPS